MKQGIQRFRFLAFGLSLFGVLALSAGVAYGQAISGNVVGTVTDSSGAAVANADVTATNVGTNVGTTTHTNGVGEYRFDNLPIGSYKLTVKATGFRTTSEAIEVQLNATGTARISLSPGAASETVEVSGEAPILDTTTPQIQSTYEQIQVQDLPTANSGGALGSGVLNLALLQSGVGSSGGLGAGSGPAVGGQRPRDNNFTVEGVDNNDKGVTGPSVYVPNDAVANFSVLQNQFNAEFGHSNGGQFNIVVASGTNQFHGRLYEYFQNRNLNSIDNSVVNNTPTGQTPKNPRYDNNRFGGQVGGPIIKNKLFFFANYEYNPVGQVALPGGTLLAPTSAGYSTLLSIPGISTANVQALQKYAQASAASGAVCVGTSSGGPCSTSIAGTQVEVGNLSLNAPNYINLKSLTTSVDYNISDKDQIRGRFIWDKFAQPDTGLTGVTLPIFYTTLTLPYDLFTLSEYHSFSSSVTNEFRVGYNRHGFNYTVPKLSFLPTLDAFPNVTLDELGIDIGPDPNAPQYSEQNLYQGVDNVTWIKGSHTLKFGGEYRKYISPQKFIQRSRGDYEWTQLDGFAFDRFPDGAVNERSFGTVGYSGDQYGLFGYVNDIWKFRPNLSLNLGVRYEYTSTPYGWTQQKLNSIADVPGLITFGSPQAPKKDFMPRVGFAYSPGSSGSTSIRGGFGMGYDVLYDNIGVLSRPPQIGNTVDCPNTCSTPFLANGGIPLQNTSGIKVLDQATARARTSSYLPNHVRYPLALSWNFGVQHVFKSNYTAEVRYVGTRGEDLNVQNRLNVIDVVTPSNHLPTYLQDPGQSALDALPVTLDGPGGLLDQFNNGGFLDPAYLNQGFFSEIVGFMPWGSSTYHGLQTQLNRRFTNGLQLQAAYTYSHSIDNSTADFFSTIIAPRRPQDFRNLSAERSNSVLDHRHRFTFSAIYEVPWFKHSSSWMARNLLGNYEIAPIFTWESGQWGTVQSGTDSNLNTDGAGDRVILNPSGAHGTGSDVSALTNSSGFVVAYLATNPNAQYIKAGQGALADTGRSTLLTKPINNWDISLAKKIAVTERYRLEIVMAARNAFNHPQYVTGSVNDVQSVSITGPVQRNYFEPSKSNFNDAKATWGSNARNLTIGAKFTF
jgi:hypothetical protein